MRLYISTERCELSPLNEKDFDEVMALYTNEEVMRYLGGVRSIETVINGLKKSLKFDNISNKLKKLLKFGFEYIFTLRKNDTNAFIGLIFVSPHHNRFNTEVSFILLPKYWGNGYAFEGIKAVLDFCRGELKLKRVVSETQVANERSIKLLQRLGFVKLNELERFGERQVVYEYKLKNKKEDE